MKALWQGERGLFKSHGNWSVYCLCLGRVPDQSIAVKVRELLSLSGSDHFQYIVVEMPPGVELGMMMLLFLGGTC